MLICYLGDDEVLVTDQNNEEAFFDEWFVAAGRDRFAYERVECPKVAQITIRPTVWGA